MLIFDLDDREMELVSEKKRIVGGTFTDTSSYTGATYTYAGTDAETGEAYAYADAMAFGNYASIGSDTYSSANPNATHSSASAHAVAVDDDRLYWSHSDSNSVYISTDSRTSYTGYSVSTGGSV